MKKVLIALVLLPLFGGAVYYVTINMGWQYIPSVSMFIIGLFALIGSTWNSRGKL